MEAKYEFRTRNMFIDDIVYIGVILTCGSILPLYGRHYNVQINSWLQISIMIVGFFLPIVITQFFPNFLTFKGHGIIHDDYVEIHLYGKKVFYWADINFIRFESEKPFYLFQKYPGLFIRTNNNHECFIRNANIKDKTLVVFYQAINEQYIKESCFGWQRKKNCKI